MFAQTMAITATLAVSVIAAQISQSFSELISKDQWLKLGDQISRGLLLGFALSTLLPESLSHFGIWYFTWLAAGASFFIFGLETIFFRNHCHQSILKHKPWFFYACLLPHCILEGFTITSLHNAGSLLFFVVFLIHKTSEISVVTLSSQIHLPHNWQQQSVQWVFVLATPLTMGLMLLWQTNASSPIEHIEHWHAVVNFMSLIALVHLALFCKLCDCPQHTKRNSLSRPLLASFLATSCFFIIINMIAPHSHDHHDHDHHHHTIIYDANAFEAEHQGQTGMHSTHTAHHKKPMKKHHSHKPHRHHH